MGCCQFISKYVMFFSNLLFALSGLTLLGLGIATQLKALDLMDLGISLAPVGCMVLGSIVFLVAFFGCCGAIRESNCMLVTYAVFMIMLMVLKVILATLIFVNIGTVQDTVPEFLKKLFNADDGQQAFHELERTFECCGPSGPSSYLPNPVLPDSCCSAPPCVVIANAYKGCDTVLQNFLGTFSLVIGLIVILIAAVELIAVVFGLCLASHARNKSRRSRY